MNDATCDKCGGPRDAKAMYCPFCGATFSDAAARESPPRPAAPSAVPAVPPVGLDPRQAPARRFDPGTPARAEMNPYAPPASSGRPVILRQDTARARRLSRLAAHFLDVLLLIGAMLPGFGLLTISEAMSNVGGVVILVGFFALIGYDLFLLDRQGQTLGKLILQIRILRSDGDRASVGRIIILRSIVPAMLGAIPLFGLLDALWIFGDERRCIHDYIADTIVVEA